MENKYYVYWQTGSCRDGDYNSKLLEFDTLDEATDWIREWKTSKSTVTIIHGHEIPE